MALTDNTDTGNTSSEGVSENAAPTPANPDFIGSLPEDLQTNESLYGFEDLGGLAKSFVETHGQLSEQEKQIAELQGKMPTLPANPGEYQVQFPEGYDKARKESFLQFAHKAKMSPEQVQQAIEFDHANAQQSAQKKAQAESEAIAALKTEWGDKFETNATNAAAAVARFGGDELKQFLNESQLGNHPALIKMFHNIAEAISEDTLLTGTGNAMPSDKPRGIDGKAMLKFPSMEGTQ